METDNQIYESSQSRHTTFSYDQYLLRRQVLALTGKIRIYTPSGDLALYSEQKMFKLREDIRIYSDETKQSELLWIQARQIIDFAAAYDVVDSTSGMKVGALRRKGFRSLVRDAWEILDPGDMPIGTIQEDNMTRAMLRRLFLGSLLPQSYDVLIGERVVAEFNQRFHLFRFDMDLDFSAGGRLALDRRLGLAAAILLGIIEGKQSS
jgi:uncharacterized protein YxjI